MLFDATKWDNEKCIEFESLYKALEQPYTDYIDKLGEEFNHSPYWWCTLPASRNMLMSDAFYQVTLLSMIANHLKEDDTIDEVLVDFVPLSLDLKSWCKENGRKVKVSVAKGRGKTEFSFAIKQMLLDWSNKKAVDGFIQRCKTIAGLSAEKKYDEPLALIQEDVFQKDFSTESYVSRDFKHILKYTDENVYFLPFFISYDDEELKKLVEMCNGSADYRFLYRESFLIEEDYKKLYAFSDACLEYAKGEKVFGELNVSHILNEEIRRSARMMNCWYGVLNYQLFQRLKERDIKLGHFIDWYEAQPSSFGAYLGFHKNYPNEKCVGYTGMPVEEFNIGMYPSKAEIEKRVAPDIFAEIGKGVADSFKKKKSDLNVILTPPFRMQGIVEGEPVSPGSDKEKKVLVTLSGMISESTRLIELLNTCASYIKESHVKIMFKNHPVYGNYTLKDYGIDGVDFEYSFISGDYKSALSGVNLVITAKSAAGYETVLYGKPVIMTYSDALCCTSMPTNWKDVHYKSACDGTQLEEAMHFFLENDYQPLTLTNDETYIVKASRETVARLFA